MYFKISRGCGPLSNWGSVLDMWKLEWDSSNTVPRYIREYKGTCLNGDHITTLISVVRLTEV